MSLPARNFVRVIAGFVAVGIVVPMTVACTNSDEPDAEPDPSPSATTPASADYTSATSDPVEDSVYPRHGDERIDTLHHDLDLTWKPNRRILVGRQTVTFRAARDAGKFVLDLGAGLKVRSANLDGSPVMTKRRGDVLVVEHAIERGDQHELDLTYAGNPDPVPGPSGRADITTVGFTVEKDDQVWTMQEPYGAYTWYAVNDQPADKAMYSVRLSVPKPSVGISNGVMASRKTTGRQTRTEFQLDKPASSYLMTLAFGPYERTKAAGVNGTPITYWTPPGRTDLVDSLNASQQGLTWLEEHLGPYPFETLGFVVVPGESGMETQTMITLGDTEYSMSPEVIVHEMAHHWWGDQVSPCDWRDVWMNEGMAMYLQTLWTDDDKGLDDGTTLQQEWAPNNNAWRQEAGPPGDYDSDKFAHTNVYVPPASMWHELREELGDEMFWKLVRGWPASNDGTCATREQLVKWWSAKSGENLAGFFRSWLMSETDPQ